MNERIQELSVEAWRFTSNEVAHLSRIHNRSYSQDEVTDIFEIKFAELIIKETLQVARAGIEYGDGMEDAVYQYFGVE